MSEASNNTNNTLKQIELNNLQKPTADADNKTFTDARHNISKLSVISTIAIMIALIISSLFSFYLWRKLSNIQEHLARQTAEATNLSIEARGLAKNAQEVAREAASKSTILEAKLNEATLQRTQIDEVLQNLSRTRDENLAIDIESNLRSIQQLTQFTGSVEPLIAALKSADQRLKRSSQPRLSTVRSVLAKDLEIIQSSTFTDVPNLMVKFDEISRLMDAVTLLNSAMAKQKKEGKVSTTLADSTNSSKLASSSKVDGIEKIWLAIRDEIYKIIRVSTIENIDAVLISQEQSNVLRENLKIRIYNARLSLLSRQYQSAKTDLTFVIEAIRKYADINTTQSQSLLNTMSQVHSQLNTVNNPNIDATLAALIQASAGK